MSNKNFEFFKPSNVTHPEPPPPSKLHYRSNEKSRSQ